jgi:hypothetical protein
MVTKPLPAIDLVARMHHRNSTVIDAELQRLARRVPSLSRADLDVVATALEDLSESLILARLRDAPQDIAPLLRRIFDTPGVNS